MIPEEKPKEPLLQTARGMHDVLPARARGYARLENLARQIFSDFNFQEVRTPVLEPAALFERAIGEATDIVEKEMFTLKDRGDRLLCLRPEGTAGVVRAFIENNLSQQFAIPKFFYIGPMFRAERPQKGRYREFEQIGCESFGQAGPDADGETIAAAVLIIRKAGVESRVLLNSIGCKQCRPIYLEKLRTYLKSKTDLCAHCQSRIAKNPMRVLDCKEDAAKFADAPKTVDFLCEDCRKHYAAVKAILKTYEIAYQEEPRLVRGLDYYTRTVFEIYPSGKSGSQDALAAGGRYDGLVELLGGPETPAVGFALGVERVLNEVESQGTQPAAARRGVFVIVLGEKALEFSRKTLLALREAGVKTEAGQADQSIKSQMRLADRMEMEFCVIIGDNEIASGSCSLKDLGRKSQENVPFGEIVDKLKNYYARPS